MTRRAVTGSLTAAAVGALLLGGCSQDVTPPRVEHGLGTTFANLYVQQQLLLGRGARDPLAVGSRAVCGKGSRGSSQHGPGDDWVCVQSWVGADGALHQATYDLTVRGDGCFTAEGSATVVGPATITTPAGRPVRNPLAAFDGCFAT